MPGPVVFAYRLHKWMALFIGLQVLIWLASGLYMVAVHIDFIHGDPLVKNTEQVIELQDEPSLDVKTIRSNYPAATQIGLKPVMEKSFYTVSTADERFLLDPSTGQVVSPLDEAAIRDIAKFHFSGDAEIVRAFLVTSDPPTEIRGRRLPLWRVDFDDRFSSSFYIDPYTGSLATRRHRYWRIFDFLWMLHIMDYDERSDAHNPLLVIAQLTGLLFTISGLWLLYYRLRRHRGRNYVKRATSA